MAELKARTQVTHAYHMGCYASLPALRIAQGFEGVTDIVHTEVCSLHFDPLSLVPEQIVVQSLFADGHIRYRLDHEPPIEGFQIEALMEKIIPESSEMMTWTPGKSGFHMTLDRRVPELLKANLNGFIDEILDLAKIERSESLIFAIHPGGPKIIEAVEEALNLFRHQSTESHEVLRKHGNMSSATLPHVWKAILENRERRDGQAVVSLAFGPGLTLSGGVFRLCRS